MADYEMDSDASEAGSNGWGDRLGSKEFVVTIDLLFTTVRFVSYMLKRM